MDPGNRPRSCIPVSLVQRKVSSGHVAGLVDGPTQANPTTSPRSLILVARFKTPAGVPSRWPRSVGEPLLSQSTACGANGIGEIAVFEHKPDAPTAWPLLFTPLASPTVSPGKGCIAWIRPSGPQLTASKRRT